MKRLLTMFSVLLFAGCGIYNPQAVDIPLIDHAGEVRLNGSVGATVLMAPVVAATASYGFNDWLSGQAFASYDFSRLYLQMSPGVYFPLGGRSRMECYVGLGFGNHRQGLTDDLQNNGSETDYAYDVTGHYLLPFVQLNYGLRGLADGMVDLAFGLKAGAFFPQFSYHYYDAGYIWVPANDHHYSTNNLLLEPQVQVTIGDGNLRFTGRLGMALLSDVITLHSEYFWYDPLTLSCGLTFFL